MFEQKWVRIRYCCFTLEWFSLKIVFSMFFILLSIILSFAGAHFMFNVANT